MKRFIFQGKLIMDADADANVARETNGPSDQAILEMTALGDNLFNRC